MNLIDNGYEGKCLNWFTVSSASGRGTKYKLEIAESVKYTCKFLSQIDTPCKHIIYIYLYIFNIPESLYIIQPLYLTKTELKKLSPSLFEYIVSEETALTTAALLKLPSNISKFRAPLQPQLKSSDRMPTKLSLTETQNDPYWILKRSRHIKKCHRCEEEVEENVIRRWEIDFNLKVDKQNCMKFCASKVDSFYYHLNIECL